MTARVAGLDLSMTATGVIDHLGEAHTIRPTWRGDRRLLEIRDCVGLIVGADLDLAVLEEAPPGLKGPAIKAIHMVHGAVRCALHQWGIRYAAINPTTLKLFAAGKRGATKADMALALYKRAGLELADDNQVDAAWLRFAGLELLGEPAVKLPAVQVAALDVVRGQLAVAS